MTTRLVKGVLRWAALPMALALTCADCFYASPPAAPISTEQYISSFDPKRYERAGTDYFSARYSPARLNKPVHEIDVTFDYPFSYIDGMTEKYRQSR